MKPTKTPFTILKPIYSTTNYSQFSHSKFNRAEKKGYNDKKVQTYINKYKNGEFIPELQHINTNKNLVIWEGNHRFEACKTLGLPIYFVIDEHEIVNGSEKEMSRFQRIFNGEKTSWERNQIFNTAINNNLPFAVEIQKLIAKMITEYDCFDKRSLIPSKIIGLVLQDAKKLHGGKMDEKVLESKEYVNKLKNSDIFKSDLEFYIVLSQLIEKIKIVCEKRLILEVAFEFIWNGKMTKKQIYHFMAKEGLSNAMNKKDVRDKFDNWTTRRNPKNWIGWGE